MDAPRSDDARWDAVRSDTTGSDGPGGPGPIPRLHVLVPDRVARAPSFERTAADLWRRAGPHLALHLRLEELPVRRIHELARRLAGPAAEAGGWCVVNGRVDVALSTGAQGVQLGAGALPVADARRLLGPRRAVGASVHAPREARRAGRAGANLVLLGTIFPTPSHPGRPGAGPARVAACRDAGPAVIAVGGVTPGRVAAVRGAGGHGVAAMRGIWDAERPERALERYLEALGAGADGER